MYCHFSFPRNPCIRFSSTGNKVISNTAIETSIFDGGTGSLTINPHLYIGNIIRIYATGYLSTGSAQNSTIRFKLNGTTLVASLGTLPNNLSNNYFETTGIISVRECGANGKVTVQGRSIISVASGIAGLVMRPIISTGEIPVDLTPPQTIDVSYQWAEALEANSLTITNSYVEIN